MHNKIKWNSTIKIKPTSRYHSLSNGKTVDVSVAMMSGVAATTTVKRSAMSEIATGHDGREIFFWQVALLSQHRSQVWFFLLLRPVPSGPISLWRIVEHTGWCQYNFKVVFIWFDFACRRRRRRRKNKLFVDRFRAAYEVIIIKI